MFRLWFPSTSRLRLQNTSSFALKQQFTPVFPDHTCLNDVYLSVGYSLFHHAKRAVVQNFKAEIDFKAVPNEGDGYNENTGRSEDGRFVSEII